MIDLTELQTRLETLPSEIARQAEITEKARFSYDIALAEYKRIEAKTGILIKTSSSITATDLKYRVTANEEVFNANLECINKESEWRRKEIELDRVKDEFVSLRKVAEIKLREMQLFQT